MSKRLVVAVVLLAGCKDSDKVVNFQIKLRHAPQCAADGDRTGNSLKRTLVVRAETTSSTFAEFSTTGTNYGDGTSSVNGQVMLAKTGKQTVKFRFAACPSKEKPTGTVRDLGCNDTELQWYAEQEVTLDPKELVIFGENGESNVSVEWPWPASELACWTGTAAPAPTPI